MSAILRLKYIVRRRFWIIGTAMMRFKIRSASALRYADTVVRLMALVCAVASMVCVTVLLGYDHTMAYRQQLRYVIHVSQWVFAANVLYHAVFDFKHTFSMARSVSLAIDVALLVTLVPLVWPCPAHPWVPWLADVAYSRWFIYPVVVAYSVLTVSYAVVSAIGKRTNPSLLLSCSFLVIILCGSILLQLPRCTYAPLEYCDALFVSTSAVCITGLTPVEIYSTFTPLGQLILLMLVQVGCLGLMTFTCLFAMFFSGNASIYSQLMLKDMVYSRTMNALIPTLRYIFVFTVAIEAAGAVAVFLSVRDTTGLPLSDEIWFSVFHSVSSFCNAGFSVLPQGMANPVLMYGNLSVYWITSALIMAGAIGFPILTNFKDTLGIHIHRVWMRLRHKSPGMRVVHDYNMNTLIVLTTFGLLFLFGCVAFLVLEYDNTLAGMSLAEKVTQSVFNSATPRSAGFSSVNPSGFLPSTLIVVMFLMWVGGGSQSTAGGIKVNTFAAICLNLKAVVTGKSSVTAFSRTIAVGSIRRANAVVALSILSYAIFSFVLVVLEPGLPVRDLLFESLSALFTVGSSLGVTPQLCGASEVLLCAAMFLGRVGIISLLTGLTPQQRDGGAKFPNDVIIIS